MGDYVKKGQVVAILESMKMEIMIRADQDCAVKRIVKKQGQFVDVGDPIMVIENGSPVLNT